MLRLAMWSGPRNISTAMMRSWENRGDCAVCDEPLYAYYLAATGKPHPLAEEVISAGETDLRRAAAWLTGPIPDGKPIFYQKQMTHHLLPETDRQWLLELTHCFLIREPREVLTSYIKKNRLEQVEDLGFVQQAELFRWLQAETGQTPAVLDARDILNNPSKLLGQLCEHLDVPFTERMLQWPPGLRASDGVWARHWYPEVEHSTTFRPYQAKNEPVPEEFQEILQTCAACYEALADQRLR